MTLRLSSNATPLDSAGHIEMILFSGHADFYFLTIDIIIFKYAAQVLKMRLLISQPALLGNLMPPSIP